MTVPTFQPAVVAQRSQTPALADRAQQLSQAHPWMPADMTTTLAASPTSDNGMLGIADSIKNSLSRTWNGFSEAMDDQVLHKQPTAALALTRMLNSSLGPLPVAQEDLTTVQRNLQKQGFGQGLEADGEWGADWNDAYNSWSNHVITRQLAGDEPASTSTGSAGHHFWDALLPSHAINAIVGFAKSVPGDLRDLTADVVGSTVNTVAGLGEALTGNTRLLTHAGMSDPNSPGAQAYQGVESFLGNPHAHERLLERINHPAASTLQSVGTILAIAPVVGAASKAADAARVEIARGVTREAAQRGPGVIAKTFLGGLSEDQIEAGAARRGLLNSNVVRNIPLLGQAGPLVGRLADETGLYYRGRTLLATPYALPAVRVAGDIGQRTMLTGAGLRLGAEAAQAIGGPSPLTQDVQNTDLSSTVDRNLARIVGDPSAHPFTDAVNALGFVLHGPLGDTANSTAVGDAVDATRNVTAHVFGQYGVEGAWERAISKATGKKTTIDDLHKAFGSEDLADRFLTMKTAEIAAAHHAQRQAQEVDGLSFGDPGYREAVGQHADDVWANPELHQAALRGVTADKFELENRLAADAMHAGLNPRNYTPGEIVDGDTAPTLGSYVGNAKKWMDAGGELTQLIRNGQAASLYGGQGVTAIRDAQDAFDFGFGTETPVRLLNQTRRQYVHQVSTLFQRVKTGVDKARVQAGRAVTDAQSKVDAGGDIEETNLLKAAKQAQQRVEAAISSGRLERIGPALKNGPRASAREWTLLSQDHGRLRDLIRQGLGPEETYNLPDLLERGVNPDDLYTRINGEPRIPDFPIGSAEWIRANTNQEAGTLGLGRVGTKSVQEAERDITALEARAQTALEGNNPDQLTSSLQDMADYGFTELGLTARSLGVFDDPEHLAGVLREHASQLASDVFLPPDASPELRAAVQRIRDLGYKPMMGSHIGHLWDGSLPPIEDLKGAVTAKRRLTDALGLGVNAVSSKSRAQDARIRILREVDRVTRDPKFKAAPRATAETYLQVLKDHRLLEPQLKLPEKVVLETTRRLGLHPGIKQLASSGLSMEDAAAEYERGLAESILPQLRDIPRKNAVKALTTPGEGVGPHGPWEWTGLDRPSANMVVAAIRKGYADRPNYLLGLSAVEDWMRGGFWFGDRLAMRFPRSELVQRMANLPNDLITLRNRLRFTLQPVFDLRRVTKTDYKMSLDGVSPVWDPLRYLVSHGEFEKAHDYLNSITDNVGAAGFDDADRYLHSQSVWGLYNAQHFKAYYAWQKKAQGATDDEIRHGLHRVFEYGSTRGGGRTPLEASVNTIFFPFSFEKTLLRNTGMYLLDHPQQALLATGIINAYDQANKHDAVSNWVSEHLPILRDLQQVNAFAHGISPGQAGGINAPLLNLFMPQQWGHQLSTKNAKTFLPVWKSFGQLMSDVHEQADITRNAALNAFDYAVTLGKPRSPFDPYRTTMTPWAQREHASVMRNQFISALTPILDHNAHAGDASQEYVWPSGIGLPPKIEGQAVTRTSIGYLVQRWYPAYDPTFSQQYAVQQEDAANTAIAAMRSKNPAAAQQWGVLVKLANSYSQKVNDGEYTTPQAVELSNQFRHLAVAAAETQPGFLKFYSDHFRWIFGPIEAVNA